MPNTNNNNSVNLCKGIKWVDNSQPTPVTHDIQRVVYCDSQGSVFTVGPCDAVLNDIYIVKLSELGQAQDSAVHYTYDSNTQEPSVILAPESDYAVKATIYVQKNNTTIDTGTDCYMGPIPGQSYVHPNIEVGENGTVGKTNYGSRYGTDSANNQIVPEYQFEVYRPDDTAGTISTFTTQNIFGVNNATVVNNQFIGDPNNATPVVLKRADISQEIIIANTYVNQPIAAPVSQSGTSIRIWPKFHKTATNTSGGNGEKYMGISLTVLDNFTHNINYFNLQDNQDGSGTIEPLSGPDGVTTIVISAGGASKTLSFGQESLFSLVSGDPSINDVEQSYALGMELGDSFTFGPKFHRGFNDTVGGSGSRYYDVSLSLSNFTYDSSKINITSNQNGSGTIAPRVQFYGSQIITISLGDYSKTLEIEMPSLVEYMKASEESGTQLPNNLSTGETVYLRINSSTSVSSGGTITPSNNKISVVGNSLVISNSASVGDTCVITISDRSTVIQTTTITISSAIASPTYYKAGACRNNTTISAQQQNGQLSNSTNLTGTYNATTASRYSMIFATDSNMNNLRNITTDFNPSSDPLGLTITPLSTGTVMIDISDTTSSGTYTYDIGVANTHNQIGTVYLEITIP